MRTAAKILLAVAAVAMAPLAPMAAAGEEVFFKPGAEVARAFEKGAPLIEVGGYKVHASRREAPGMAEVHETDTDIIYVLEGAATLVTGGRVVEGKATAPSEIRGARIEGGTARTLSKGDVIVVPNGTPHWFSGVHGPLLYYVVKVTAQGGGNKP